MAEGAILVAVLSVVIIGAAAEMAYRLENSLYAASCMITDKSGLPDIIDSGGTECTHGKKDTDGGPAIRVVAK